MQTCNLFSITRCFNGCRDHTQVSGIGTRIWNLSDRSIELQIRVGSVLKKAHTLKPGSSKRLKSKKIYKAYVPCGSGSRDKAGAGAGAGAGGARSFLYYYDETCHPYIWVHDSGGDFSRMTEPGGEEGCSRRVTVTTRAVGRATGVVARRRARFKLTDKIKGGYESDPELGCDPQARGAQSAMVQILPMASTIRLSISSFATTRFGGCISMCNSSSRFNSLRLASSGMDMDSDNLPIKALEDEGLGPQSQNFGLKDCKIFRQEGNSKSAKTIVGMAQGSTTTTQENALDWVKSDKRRMLHVVYRVGDLDRTIKFYTECLGMKLLRKRDIPEERYTNAFLGYGPEDSHFVIELTYNYGVDKYDIGAGFGHFGIAVDDVAKTVDLIKAKGGTVTREPGPVKGGKSIIAFIEDPDGYKFELIERGPTPEPLCQVMLRVGDLDRSIAFHEKAFGMELLRRRDNPEYKYTIAMMGYGPEDKNAVLELTYNYGVTEYDKGNAYAQIAIGTDDVYKTAEAVKLFGGKITREPGPLPGISTKITACLDPDGWKTVFVDNIDFLKELE
ncbi:hypothetical protein E3N88_28792 [Mikania micrantha]|uniref:lactoylglutathione lyase n=1 Tax=Mikania micrantha TaxID=192012 RepID=A0A5N6N117_9ASTR|nr:hypothetical protein E3N88_28792 [Mikania micrantha]